MRILHIHDIWIRMKGSMLSIMVMYIGWFIDLFIW